MVKEKNYKLKTLISRYLKKVEKDNPGCRDFIKGILNTKSGNKIIIDGYSAILFKTYEKEFEEFPQKEDINFERLFTENDPRDLTAVTEDIKILFYNMDELKRILNDKLLCYLDIEDNVYNYEVLEIPLRILKYYDPFFNHTKYQLAGLKYKRLIFENEFVKIVICSVNLDKYGKEKVKEDTETIIKELKEGYYI